jgi:DNA-binding GntR family transcriptional regulator
MQVSIAEHAEIVDALCRLDAARCEALLAQHVGDAYERLISNIQPETPVETNP